MGWLLLWLLAVSVVDFILMGADKHRARCGAWRIPEKAFFLIALLGGTPGAILGMWIFHHKTRHWYFKFGLPAILVGQLALAGWLAVKVYG